MTKDKGQKTEDRRQNITAKQILIGTPLCEAERGPSV